MKKKAAVLLLCMVLCAIAFAQQNAGDFRIDANGVITSYEGFATAVVIPAQIGGVRVTAIGDGVFNNSNLTAVTLPAGLTSIGANAFAQNRLTSVTIPGSVTSIGERAFAGNGNLRTLVLPANLRFGKNVFGDSVFFDYIFNDRKAGTYDATVNYFRGFAASEGDFQFHRTRFGALIIRYTGSGGRVVIPQRLGGLAVKGIYSPSAGEDFGAVFQGNPSRVISHLQIPAGIIYIGEHAFARNRLTSVTIPNSVTSIGGGAFAGNHLTSIAIPSSVTFIGGHAFARNQLTSVTIPGSVTSIGAHTFANNQLTSFTIPSSVTSIGASAFADNQLTSVTIPGSVTSIGEKAFANNQLTSVTIPESVTFIDAGVFARNQLISVTISGSVTSIGWGAFENNPITSVAIGINVDGFDSGMFCTVIPNAFGAFYISNGRQAGTYIFDGSRRSWSRQ